MTTLKLLKSVRKLFNSPNRWVKRELETKGPDGKQSYCIVGAIAKILKQDSGAFVACRQDTENLARALNIKTNNGDLETALVYYNNDDRLKYRGFIARIDRAIKRLEAKI